MWFKFIIDGEVTRTIQLPTNAAAEREAEAQAKDTEKAVEVWAPISVVTPKITFHSLDYTTYINNQFQE